MNVRRIARLPTFDRRHMHEALYKMAVDLTVGHDIFTNLCTKGHYSSVPKAVLVGSLRKVTSQAH